MSSLISYPTMPTATITAEGFSVWSSLPEDGLVSGAQDLALKHGTQIPGVWHLLGILDAVPNPIPPQIPIPASNTPTHFGQEIENQSNIGPKRQLLLRQPFLVPRPPQINREDLSEIHPASQAVSRF
jgi:hypothetical protein